MMSIDVERRLEELAGLLALDDTDLSAAVVGAVATLPARPVATRRRSVLIAAAVLLVIVAAVATVTPARNTVTGWLGLDRVEIDRRDDLVVPSAPSATPAVTQPATSGPLDERMVTFDGATVLLGVVDGRLDDVFITKSVGGGTAVESMDIDGMPALWIADAHEVLIERSGQPASQRFAAGTLLWQDGDVLWRVEGFTNRDDAVAFARSR